MLKRLIGLTAIKPIHIHKAKPLIKQSDRKVSSISQAAGIFARLRTPNKMSLFVKNSDVDRIKQSATRNLSTNTHSKKVSKQTTGWTEETRNQFHPGCIITAMRMDYSGYSPHGFVGMTELSCHVLGQGREACQPFIAADGSILGFYMSVIPKVQLIKDDLRKFFPELAEAADSLGKRDLKKIFSSPKEITLLQAEIENKFGKTVDVRVCHFDKNKVNQNIRDKHSAIINMWERNGATIIFGIKKQISDTDTTQKPRMGNR